MEIRLARTRTNMILEISVVFGWGRDNSHKYLEIYMSRYISFTKLKHLIFLNGGSIKQGLTGKKTNCSIGTQPTVLFTANS
jgi:hypothetical protein